MSPPQPDGTAPPSTSGQHNAAELFAQRFQRLNRVIYPATQGRPYTEQEIADAVGMSVSQISNLRNGKSVPRADRAVTLARLYGVRVEYFFSPNDDSYVHAVEEQLEAIERERRGEPYIRGNRQAGSSAEADADLLDDDQVRSIAEGVAILPHDMRETVKALVDQLRRAADTVGLRRKTQDRRPR
ncbi:helix-turn-helix transcriptional regulator [Streptomyces hygroscopicus]|uniref:helix-turn-helix transcriptional regulator n=1 Tax=Streptomyces hygroscopicus TaxID=1912 RepID=UPI0033E3709B